MIDFIPINNAAPVAGLVLSFINESPSRYLRITHVFSKCVFLMEIAEPYAAHTAKRPRSKPISWLVELLKSGTAVLGRVPLPMALTLLPEERSDAECKLSEAWKVIEPLVDAFSYEVNLAPQVFTKLIIERANQCRLPFVSVRRQVLRHYYFGAAKSALLPLPRGVKPGQGGYVATSTAGTLHNLPCRRGPKSMLFVELGPNNFVVTSGDIDDMVACYKSCLRKGPVAKTTAHEKYLAGRFRTRHPQEYDEYIRQERPEPVTIRQFRYYIDGYARLEAKLARNQRPRRKNGSHPGSVRAGGPGEVYEIDATGGRVHLVSSSKQYGQLGKPTIYIIIDRWSRYIVSIYVSLRSPSYEEVRHSLLIALTSRRDRFDALGVVVDDTIWPVGRMPAVLCPDRGSEFMSDSMENAIVNDLRIELTPLPPLCPDGKAIVERFIREIKRRMATSKISGVYAERPMDPDSKRAYRDAKTAAVDSLASVYRLLLEIVIDHNSRPHASLRRRTCLVQAGIPPVPKDAYLWGLKNISGLRTAPLTDEDYRRFLLSSDVASIVGGILRYKGRPYVPCNETATDLARMSTAKAKQIPIRLDKTCPTVIEVANRNGPWATFRIADGAANELRGTTLDEEDVHRTESSYLWKKADYTSRVARVKRHSQAAPTREHLKATGSATTDKASLRREETAKVKSSIVGTDYIDALPEGQSAEKEIWDSYAQAERDRQLNQIRKQRRKR